MRRMPKPITAAFTATVLAMSLCMSCGAGSTLGTGSNAKREKFGALSNGTFTGGLTGTKRSALVLYDTSGEWGWLGELYAIQAANLTGHFGTFTISPVGSYRAGEMARYTAVLYVGSSYDGPLPAAFLTDVRSGARPVIWMDNNIEKLAASTPTFAADYGWKPSGYDRASIGKVVYKNRTLTRDATNKSGVMAYSTLDKSKVKVLATAITKSGTRLPWAIRSRNLTYIGELPLTYISATDRYLIFADLLFDVLAPTTPARHRALIRLEDVGPNADPADLESIRQLLETKHVPYSVGIYPVYRDPQKGVTIRLIERPALIKVLKSMVADGATLVMHGYTHQYSTIANPYSGVSGSDFEFFRAHVDAKNDVQLDGPVPDDSYDWALQRMDDSAKEFRSAGLPVPRIFEFPHYAASTEDYRAVGEHFATRYERGLYIGGLLSGSKPNYAHTTGQFFPYVVTDVYGQQVIPENLGNVETKSFNNHPVVLPPDLIKAAEANLVVRDGVASFFYHPYLKSPLLGQTIDGIRKLGYQFGPPGSL
jgi:uncharacterized protein YdaL